MANPAFKPDPGQNDVVDSMIGFGVSFLFFFGLGVIATIISLF